MNGRVLIKAITEIDGRLVQTEVYVDLGQSVVPMIRDGKLSLTIRCEHAPALGGFLAGKGLVGEAGPEAIMPTKKDCLAEAVEKWLPNALTTQGDYYAWVSAKPTRKLSAKHLNDPSSDTEAWLASKVAAKFAKEQAKMAGGDETLREFVHTEISAGLRRGDFDRALAAIYSHGIPAVTPTPPLSAKPSAPTAIRVLFDGYPIPHAIACSEAEGWVDVLLFTEGGEPIWDASRQAWKAERLSGRVQRIEDKP
jgi:hypothetical protein